MRCNLTNTCFCQDWVSLCVYAIIPIVIASMTMYAGMDNWWEITTLTWFMCIFVYFAIFCVVSIFYELNGCYELIKFSNKLQKIRENVGTDPTNLNIIKQGVLLSLRQKISGTVTYSYMSNSESPILSQTSLAEIEKKQFATKPRIGLYSRLTLILSKCGIFKDLGDDAKRYYSVDEVRDYAPYVTSESWGLERLFFRNRQSRYVAVVTGDSALTGDQILSSFACDIIGTFLIAFTLVAFLVWMNPPRFAVIVFAVLFLLWIFGRLRGSYGRWQVYQTVVGQSKRNLNNYQSSTLYQVEETFRKFEARDSLCLVLFAVLIIFFMIIPLFTLFFTGNFPLGFLFIPTSIITGARFFFNSSACAQEIGSLDGIEKNNRNLDNDFAAEEEWREKHRLSNIIGQISSGPRNRFWIYAFIVFVLVFCMITVVGIATGSDDGGTSNIGLAGKQFFYPGSTNLEYATCTLGKGGF